MSSLGIRDIVYNTSPPWMKGPIGTAINYAFAIVADALADKNEQGVKLAFPGIGSPTALGNIGNDRQIDRGPNQSDSGYVVQLRQAFDTWQNAGGARTILEQLRAYFAPDDGPSMRLVAQHPSGVGGKAIWHVIDTATAVVTKSYHDNWLWDATTKHHRGWVIIDGTGRWLPDFWDQLGTWGDGGVWASNMTYTEARSFVNSVRKWKPTHVLAQIIITFDPTLFLDTATRPPNPNGNGDDDSWRAVTQAAFMEPITT